MRHEIHKIASAEALSALRNAWETLMAASIDYSASVSYQYCQQAAVRVFRRHGYVLVTMVYDEGRLIALWPLAVDRILGVRVAQTITCGSREEYGGPLTCDPTRVDIMEYCVNSVQGLPVDVLEIGWIEEGSSFGQALDMLQQPPIFRMLPEGLSKGDGHRGFPKYTIAVDDYHRWSEFYKTRTKSARYNYERSKRRLSEEVELEIGWCDTKEEADKIIRWIFANKKKWAEGRGIRTKYLMDNEARDFFLDLVHELDPRKSPMVAAVRAGGVPVAASINLVGLRSVEYFVTTFDKAYSRYSVGVMLLNFVAEWSHTNNRHFDMRYVYEEYKSRWANSVTRCRRYRIFLAKRSGFALLVLAALVTAKIPDLLVRAFKKAGRLIGQSYNFGLRLILKES